MCVCKRGGGIHSILLCFSVSFPSPLTKKLLSLLLLFCVEGRGRPGRGDVMAHTQRQPLVETRLVSEDIGLGIFATADIPCAAEVMRERPVAFAQSYHTWRTTPSSLEADAHIPHVTTTPPSLGSPSLSSSSSEKEKEENEAARELRLSRLQHIRCCFGCGTPLTSVRSECFRLEALAATAAVEEGGGREETEERDSSSAIRSHSVHSTEDGGSTLWQEVSEALNHTSSCADEATHCSGSCLHNNEGKKEEGEGRSRTQYVVEEDANGVQHTVSFCCPACEAHALYEDGKCLVLTAAAAASDTQRAVPNATQRMLPHESQREKESDVRETRRWRFPSFQQIIRADDYPARHSQSDELTWPPQADVRTVWPTRLAALSTIHHVARQFNERAWLLTLLLARVLQETLEEERRWCTTHTVEMSVVTAEAQAVGTTASSAASVPVTDVREKVVRFAHSLRARLTSLVESYADGATSAPNAEQRALLRYTWRVVTWWVLLCFTEEARALCDSAEVEQRASAVARSDALLPNAKGTSVEERSSLLWPVSDVTRKEGEEERPSLLHVLWRTIQHHAIPLQLYLQLHWLSDANVHAYIVVSPLYTTWCALQRHMEDHNRREGDTAPGSSPSPASHLMVRVCDRLRELFLRRLPSSVTPHATGAALYDVVAKLNHSCVPSVQLVPTHGAVQAVVIARRDIHAGEQVWTSYMNVSPAEEEEEKRDVNATADDRLGTYVADNERRRQEAQRRRAYLRKNYGFVCSCHLCAILDT